MLIHDSLGPFRLIENYNGDMVLVLPSDKRKSRRRSIPERAPPKNEESDTAYLIQPSETDDKPTTDKE